MLPTMMTTDAQEEDDNSLPETEETAEKIIKNKTICLALSLKKMGTKRKVPSSTSAIETETDRNLLLINKIILESAELDKITTLDGQVKASVKKKALTVEMPIRGCYLLPIKAVDEVDKTLNECKAERAALVQAYISNYPGYIADAEKRLGQLFNIGDYLDVALVADSFKMVWTYPDTFKVPTNLKEISNQIFNREIERMGERCQTMLAQVEVGLVDYMDGFITKIVDCLAIKPNGKAKSFNKASIQNFLAFLDQLPQMNISNNKKVAELGLKAKQIMEGADASVLRKDMSVRQLLQDKLQALQTTDLAPLIENRPARKFSFED